VVQRSTVAPMELALLLLLSLLAMSMATPQKPLRWTG